MEFKVIQKELELQSRGWIPTFHDVTKEVLEIVKESGVKNGTVTIASHHTTCSVMVQEASHDIDSFDLEFLQHDLLDIMRKMIPDFAEEHQYRHPGPIHARYGRHVNEPGDYTSIGVTRRTAPMLILPSSSSVLPGISNSRSTDTPFGVTMVFSGGHPSSI